MADVKSLRLQFSAALMTVLIMFSGTTAFTVITLEEQHNNNIVLTLVGRLEVTARLLMDQAMNYKRNLPRDNATYLRDLRLYYPNLMALTSTFDRISDAFMRQTFEPAFTGLSQTVHPKLNARTMEAVNQIEKEWLNYRQRLLEALGPESGEPRLETAADYIIANSGVLEGAIDNLLTAFQQQLRASFGQIRLINSLMVSFTVIIGIGIALWFFFRVLRPLDRAARGFQQVAQGDFGYQVKVSGNNEISLITTSFNHLSRRLHAIFRLVDRIQQGSDLDETLHFVAEEFAGLLPLDWVAVLFVTGDRSCIKLERSYMRGEPEIASRPCFPLSGTLLEQALQAGEPLHIPDMEETAKQNPTFRFLNQMVEQGQRDAIFLPFSANSPLPGVLAFASCQPNTYTPEHLELLTNIAHLVAHSFGRTVRLAEHARLAAIGEFVSGIAHEIRSPLATIGIALDYFNRADLPGSASKRAQLAIQETERMARLMDEMLLYAKPLQLEFRAVDMRQLVEEVLDNNRELAKEKQQRFELTTPQEVSPIPGDRSRLTQIFINLMRNACEAAPVGSTIQWHIHENRAAGTLQVEVRNGGDPIPEDLLPRLFEPFFTTKGTGTGLGLGIVKRLVEAHGGDIQIISDQTQGTRATVTFPLLQE